MTNSTTSCEDMNLLISRSIDCALDATEQSVLDRHLDECARCRQESRALRATDLLAHRSLQGLRQEPQSLARGVLERAARAAEEPAPRHDASIVRGVGIAAAIVVGIGGILLVAEAAMRGTGYPDRADDPPSVTGAARSPRVLPFDAISCEIDPRGVDVHWDEIATDEIESFVVERFDGHGGRATFETDDPWLLDVGIQAGEQYFYVVHERAREEAMAFIEPGAALGVGTITIDAVDSDLRVRFVGGTLNVPVLEVTFTSEGEEISHRFLTRVGERVGGEADIAGGRGDFSTPWFLVAIDWDAERTILDPETRDVRTVTSRSCVLERSGPGPAESRQVRLWIRE